MTLPYDIQNGDSPDADKIMANFNVALMNVGSDLVLGAHTGNTNETEIAEVLISANTVKTGVIIMASGYANLEADESTTIRLRTGTNSSGSFNTERLSTSRSAGTWANSSNMGWAINWVLTAEETWTSDVYIHITVQGGQNGVYSYCENLVVIGW